MNAVLVSLVVLVAAQEQLSSEEVEQPVTGDVDQVVDEDSEEGRLDQPSGPGLEATTPNIPGTPALDMFRDARRAAAVHAADVVNAPRLVLGEAADHAVNGNGGAVLGLRPGSERVRASWQAARDHAADTVTGAPRRFRATLRDASATQREVLARHAHFGVRTGETWREVADDSRADAAEFAERRDQLRTQTRQEAASAVEDAGQLVLLEREATDKGIAATWEWNRVARARAWTGMTTDAVGNHAAALASAEATRHWWMARASEALDRAGAAPAKAWRTTLEGTAGVVSSTGPESVRVFDRGSSGARRLGSFLIGHRETPLRAGSLAIRAVSAWNVDLGWTQGMQQGLSSARNAWDHDDAPMAAAWASSGVGRALWHLAVLEPVLAGALLASIPNVYCALYGVGLPLAGTLLAGGAGLAGVTAVSGVFAAGALLASGTLATVTLAGANLGWATALGATSIPAAAVVGAVGLGISGAAAVVWSAVFLGAPVMAATGTVAVAATGATAVVGTVALTGARIAARAVVNGLGEAAYAGQLVAFGAGRVVGASITTGLGALALPAHTTAAWGRHGARAVERAVASPVSAVGETLVTAGTAVHTLSGAGVVMAGGTVVAGATSVANGLMATAHVGMAGLSMGGVAVEYAQRALNIPQHRAWAAFRADETAQALEHMRGEGAPSEASTVILTRVHWWGDDTGRVRFFVTRDPQTGKRWYFERVLDAGTCEVTYRGSDEDPAVRALGRDPWKGTWRTGLVDARCMEARLPAAEVGAPTGEGTGDAAPEQATDGGYSEWDAPMSGAQGAAEPGPTVTGGEIDRGGMDL